MIRDNVHHVRLAKHYRHALTRAGNVVIGYNRAAYTDPPPLLARSIKIKAKIDSTVTSDSKTFLGFKLFFTFGREPSAEP